MRFPLGLSNRSNMTKIANTILFIVNSFNILHLKKNIYRNSTEAETKQVNMIEIALLKHIIKCITKIYW